jgi:type II secretory pathway component PulK
MNLDHTPPPRHAGAPRSPGDLRGRAPRSQRGMALIIVITVFAIAMAFCAAWSKTTLSRMRRQQLAEQKAQVAWLAQAGVRRGAARLAADANYVGESWRVPAAELARIADAQVEIRIETPDETTSVVQITAIAAYPAEQARVRVRKTVTYSPAAEEPQP